MARILLAWELGAGLGHVGRLKPIADELARRGHAVTLCLLDLVGTRALLRDIPYPCLQAPVALQDRGTGTAPMSLAEILDGCGYRDPDVLDVLVRAWRATLACTAADALVADFAPTAILAARASEVPAAAVGLGFAIPPAGLPLPSFRPWERVEPGRLERAEAGVLGVVNHVLARHGARPCAQGWELFAGDRALLCDWPELDCYARGTLPEGDRWHGQGFAVDVGEPPAWPAGNGPRVFAYLKGRHPDVEAVLRALVTRGCRTICYLAAVPTGQARPVEHPSIRYSSGPVDLGEALPACDLVVCHAGGGTTARALLAGVPLLLLPRQNEQGLNSLSIARLRAGVASFPGPRPFDYAAALRQLLDEGDARAAARAFADAHRDFANERQARDLADAVETLAAGAAARE